MQEMKSLNGFKLVDVDGRQLIKEAEGRANSKISKVSKRITNLENGYDEDLFTTDATAAYQKTVPENALPYAEIKKVYGRQENVGGVIIPRKVVRIESYGRETRKPLDATLIASEVGLGMTVEKLADGSFKFNGYTSEGGDEHTPAFATVNLPEDGRYCLYYKIKSNTSGANISLSLSLNNGGTEPSFHPSIEPQAAFGGINTFYVNLNNGMGAAPVAEDLIVSFEVMKCEWTGSNIYEGSFIGAIASEPLDTLEIPEEVTSLKGYGMYKNYIDFERGVYIYEQDIIDNTSTNITPTEEIDIRQHIGYDNFIEVVPDGVLRFVDDAGSNTNKRSEIAYWLKGE